MVSLQQQLSFVQEVASAAAAVLPGFSVAHLEPTTLKDHLLAQLGQSQSANMTLTAACAAAEAECLHLRWGSNTSAHVSM